ncbi:50S ribosomal protein-like protein L4 [Phaeosphaeriaceae sp. PMI808]|nr:50S ribosomal protein-like protein L4 [Phaeosphaeriaceae sp. PMI808]
MPALPSRRILRPSLSPIRYDTLLPFLVPSLNCTRITPAAHFSTTLSRCKKDNNSNRGLSPIRATGLRRRQTLSVRQKDFANQTLPTPVPIEEKPTGSPDHGLWDFFKNKELLQSPYDEQQHGRAWTVGELRSRDWDALHQLWWICVKERNRLATEKLERARIEAGYGDMENLGRDTTVQETMKAILDTLAERHQAYTDAYELAKRDPAIDLSRTDGPQFTQPAYDPLEPER